MEKENLILDARIAITSFALGTAVGMSSSGVVSGWGASALQSLASMAPANAELLSACAIGLTTCPASFKTFLDNYPKSNNNRSSELYVNSVFCGMAFGVGLGSIGNYLMSHPEHMPVASVSTMLTLGGSVLFDIADKEGYLDKFSKKLHNFFNKDNTKTVENAKEFSKVKSNEKENVVEKDYDNVKESNALSLRDTLSKSQKGLCVAIESWAEKNHIVDEKGNILLDENMFSARDAMNKLVSTAKDNGFKMKATEKPLSRAVQDEIAKDDKVNER